MPEEETHHITKRDLDDVLRKLRQERVADMEVLRKEQKTSHDTIIEMLKPISNTYTTATTLGKWATATIVFVSVLLGVIATALKLFHDFFVSLVTR